MSGATRTSEPALESWVWTENLHPWLQIVGRICGYGLDDLDWAMIELELDATSADHDRWYDYRFDGDEPIDVSIADGSGEAATEVRVWCPDHLRELVKLATDIAGEYRIR